MSALNGVFDTITANALPFVLETLWKVSAVLLAASAVAWLLRKHSSALRHLVWTFAVGAVLLVPVAAAVAPSWRIGVLPGPSDLVTTEAQNERAVVPPSRSRSTRYLDGNAQIAAQQAVKNTRPAIAQPARITLVGALLSIWLVGALAVYAWIAAGLIVLVLVARKARPVTNEGWQTALHATATRLGIRRSIRLLEADGNSTPMTFGLLSSTILLPATARDWGAARQRVVLLHELAHVRRSDVLVQIIAQFACATYWFHPLVWFAARRLRIEREHACDDAVVNAGERPSEYATHLLAVARTCHVSALQPAALAMARPSQLENRLLAVLATGVSRNQLTRTRVLVAALLSVGVVLPLCALTPVARAASAAQQSATVITHPRAADPLAERWAWAFSEAARRSARRGYWVGYSIKRQSPAGEAVISGSGGWDLRELNGAPLQTQLFGTRPPNYSGRGKGPIVERETALMFRFERGATDVAAATQMRINSLHVGMNLDGLPVFWLGSANDAQSIAWLEQQYNRPSAAGFRDEFIEAIGEHQTPSLAVPFLRRVLEREADAALRAQAAEALGEQGSPEAERLLRDVVRNDEAREVRREGAEALGALPTPTATAALLELARNADDPDVRSEATEALGEQSTSDALRALEDLVFNATDLDVQREAAESLGDMSDEMGFALLARIVRTHRRWEVRAEAAESLAEFAAARALPVLEDVIFHDSDTRVQEDAVEAAADLGDGARTLLRRVVREHPAEDVRAKAREALAEPRDRKLSFDYTDSPSASASASAAPSYDDSPAAERLPVDIDEATLISEEQARGSAEASAILALRKGLSHVPEGGPDLVRERSAWALSLVQNGHIVQPLIAALGADDWRVRAYAGWALAVVQDSRAIDALIDAARDAHWRVRMHALFALGETDGRDADRSNALIAGLDDPFWQVRYQAATYLGDVGGLAGENARKRIAADSHLAVRQAVTRQ